MTMRKFPKHTDEQIIVALAEAALRESQQRHASRQIVPTTNQQLVGRVALEQLGAGASGTLVVGEDVAEQREEQDCAGHALTVPSVALSNALSRDIDKQLNKHSVGSEAITSDPIIWPRSAQLLHRVQRLTKSVM
jgi:NADH dehydrogenase (fragment)